jgi:hypothetical protein
MNKHYESLSRLYLRLKGFLASNLILHSEESGNSKSELDIVAVRMPHHSQEYRWVKGNDFLQCSDSRIEILIADVKNTSEPRKVRFNDGLRKDKASIKQLIEWLGVYESVVQEQVEKFEKYLNPHKIEDLNGYAAFDQDSALGKFKFKFTFFCLLCLFGTGKVFSTFTDRN